MDAEITLIVPIHAKKEHRDTVRSLLMKLARKTRQEAGNICYTLHELRDDPNQFIIYEKWRGQAALDFHMEQQHLKSFLAREDELLSQKISGTFCSQISP